MQFLPTPPVALQATRTYLLTAPQSPRLVRDVLLVLVAQLWVVPHVLVPRGPPCAEHELALSPVCRLKGNDGVLRSWRALFGVGDTSLKDKA